MPPLRGGSYGRLPPAESDRPRLGNQTAFTCALSARASGGDCHLPPRRRSVTSLLNLYTSFRGSVKPTGRPRSALRAAGPAE